MNRPVIEIKNIGKKYNISHMRGGYVALRDVLANIARRPFKFLTAKAKSVAGIGTKEEFWALRNVSMEIQKGEIVGIIGRNGAGKSTLLKILTGITPPTEGEIVLRGRVASLLEVGTGFHPELTGRENIFLNGAIMGMSGNEIARKFDEIVEFAGIEQFLDTPVKYYSSGMYVRLAFSVAAHMEPDILLVDEVLAVGDAEFQKKCLGKMEEVTKAGDRTILFVSHNMGAIQRLCSKSVLLKGGEIQMFGETNKVIDFYLNSSSRNAVCTYALNPKKEISITSVSIRDKQEEFNANVAVGEEFSLEVRFTVTSPRKKALLSVFIYTEGEVLILTSESDKDAKLRDYAKGEYVTTIRIPAPLLNIGAYYFIVRFHVPGIENIDDKPNINFEIIDKNDNPQSIVFHNQRNNMGKIVTHFDYSTQKLS